LPYLVLLLGLVEAVFYLDKRRDEFSRFNLENESKLASYSYILTSGIQDYFDDFITLADAVAYNVDSPDAIRHLASDFVSYSKLENALESVLLVDAKDKVLISLGTVGNRHHLIPVQYKSEKNPRTDACLKKLAFFSKNKLTFDFLPPEKQANPDSPDYPKVQIGVLLATKSQAEYRLAVSFSTRQLSEQLSLICPRMSLNTLDSCSPCECDTSFFFLPNGICLKKLRSDGERTWDTAEFQRVFPSDWKDIDRTCDGCFHGKDGLFARKYLSFLKNWCPPEPYSIDSEVSDSIKILLHTSPAELRAKTRIFSTSHFFVLAIIFFMASAGFYFWQKIQARRTRAEKGWQLTQYAVNQSDDAVFWLRINGSIYNFNKKTGLALEYSDAELSRISMKDFDLDMSSEKLDALFCDIQKNEFATFQTRFKSKSGRVYPVEVNASNILFEGKSHVCISARDISDRIQKEHLLEEAKVLAESANKSKIEFLATMSHELRTPLNTILGFLDLLRQTPLNDEQKEFAHIAFTSGQHLLEIISGILDFSRLEAGKVTLSQEPFILRHSIEQIVDSIALKASEKNLEMILDMDMFLPEMVVGDVQRLRQILLNLLGNAIKFTREGEVQLTITAKETPLPDMRKYAAMKSVWRIGFEVRDTGIGIPESKMSKLFKIFSQLDSSATRHFGGTGIGLAISQRLCNLMGGVISVRSTENEGSVFYFDLQFEEPDEALSDAEHSGLAQYAQRVKTNFHFMQGKRLLIVDDNETNRRLLCRLMEKWGLLYDEVSCPQEALDKLASVARYDIALLDMLMPDMSGSDLARAIRNQFSPEQLPCILLSSIGHQAPPDEMGTLFQANVPKPFRQTHLYDSIFRVLSERGTLTKGAAPVSIMAPVPAMSASKPLRILVAEDNRNNQIVMEQVFKRMGYTVDIASDGQAALDHLKKCPCDVILMDVHMPVMDGLEATMSIRNGAVSPCNKSDIWIIAVTAAAMYGDAEKCYKAGMNDYLSKPISIEKLRASLLKVPSGAENAG